MSIHCPDLNILYYNIGIIQDNDDISRLDLVLIVIWIGNKVSSMCIINIQNFIYKVFSNAMQVVDVLRDKKVWQ